MHTLPPLVVFGSAALPSQGIPEPLAHGAALATAMTVVVTIAGGGFGAVTAVGCKRKHAAIIAASAAAFCGTGTFMVLTAAVEFGGWTWTIASAALLLSLHAGNLSMRSMISAIGAEPIAASAAKSETPSRATAGRPATARTTSRRSC
ncbi:MAG: hypothetical protein ACOYN0_08785 [Phycisphaerales bacterium]